MLTRKFWFVIAKFYLLLKSLFRTKNALPYLIILVVLIQLIFLVLINFKINRLEKDFEGYGNYSSTTMNRIYTQVWLLNSKEE